MAINPEDVWRAEEGDPFQVAFHEARLAHGATAVPARPDMSSLGADPIEETLIGSISNYNWPAVEYNPALRGREAIRVFNQMRRSDAQVKGGLRMVKSPVLTSHWHSDTNVDSGTPTAQEFEQAEMLRWNLSNMHRPFITFLREGLGCLDFGVYPFEIMWEMATWTPTPTEERPRPRSREVVKVLDLVPRHPARINGWRWDADGNVIGIYYGTRNAFIPRNKLLMFTFDQEGDDPWGTSILRSAYENWFYKEGFYRIDGIQKERHGIGIPRGKLPPGSTKEDKATMIELLQNLRANEKAFMLLQPNWEVDFAKPEGQMVDVLASARHHGLMILETMLVQFLNLGTEESGSRSVGNTQVQAFSDSIRYVVDFMRGVINQQLVPQLIDFNYLNPEPYPELRARRIGEDGRLRQLAVGLSLLTETGWILPGPQDEAWLRSYNDLPSAGAEQAAMGVKDRVRPLPSGWREQIQERITEQIPPGGKPPIPVPTE